MNHRSLAFRLAVWYALLLNATFALVGIGAFYGLEQYLRSSLSDSLRRRSAQIEQILAQASAGVTDAAIAESINTRVAPFNNRVVRVTRAPAVPVYRSGVPADRSFDPDAVPPSGHYLIELGTSLESIEALQHRLLLLLGLMLPVLVGFAAGGVQRAWNDVDLAELVSGTADQMRLMAEDRGIQRASIPPLGHNIGGADAMRPDSTALS